MSHRRFPRRYYRLPHPRRARRRQHQVHSALVNLGYQRPLAQKAIAAAVAKDKAVSDNFEALFRAALAGMRN